MSRDWVEVVRAGYDAMAERHLDWISQIEGDPRLRVLASSPDGTMSSASTSLLRSFDLRVN